MALPNSERLLTVMQVPVPGGELPGRKSLCWGSVQSGACSEALGHLTSLVTLLNIYLWGTGPDHSCPSSGNMSWETTQEDPGERRLLPLRAHSSVVGLRLLLHWGHAETARWETNMLLFR